MGVVTKIIRLVKQNLTFRLGVVRSNFRRSKQEVESFQLHKIKSFNNICQNLAQDRIFDQEIESSNNSFKNFCSCAKKELATFGTRSKVVFMVF